MADLHLLSHQPAEEPVVVVADHGERMPAPAEPIDERDTLHHLRATVDDISNEDDLREMTRFGHGDLRIEKISMSELPEQLRKLVVASVHIPDHIAGPDLRVLMNPGMDSRSVEIVGSGGHGRERS
jgi:hypothetical protein